MLFESTHDVFVRSNIPTNNYSAASYLRIRSSTQAEQIGYIKFDLKGIEEHSVKKATVRLYVIEGGPSGGTVFPVSSKFKDSDAAWDEATMTYETAPPIIHAGLSSVGRVEAGDTIEFDVTAAVETDGKRSFAITSSKNELVRYSSKEGIQAPELVVELGPPIPFPAITNIDPRGGVVGYEVTITGENFINVRDVLLNDVSVESFELDSQRQLRFPITAESKSGKVRVITEFGEAISDDDFFVVAPPSIGSFFPKEGPPGTEVTILGTNLGGLSAVLFGREPAVGLEFDSESQVRAIVPTLATTGSISVENAAGTDVSLDTFEVTFPPSNLNLAPVHDTFVRSAKPTTNYALHDELRVRQPHSDHVRSYLKFQVVGTGEAIKSATLHLVVRNGGEDGGKVFHVANDYQGTETPWEEDGLLWGNAPNIPVNPVAVVGAVRSGDVVEIDVSAVVDGDGEYSFALANDANDLVTYSSKDGEDPPVLKIETDFVNPFLPEIVSFSPTSGPIGTEVTIRGRNVGEAQEVSFNGSKSLSFSVDGPTQIRAIVPAGATTGKISVASLEGTGTSEQDFAVVATPTISHFEPTEGAVGSEITISGANLLHVSDVSFNGVQTSDFEIDSDSQLRARVPRSASSGPIEVSNVAGNAQSSTIFTVKELPSTLTLLPTDDSFIRSSRPTRNYGHAHELRVRNTPSAEYITYLKFEVAGLGGAIDGARLKLFVINSSDQGGELFVASNNFSSSGDAWNEAQLELDNAPVLNAGPLANLGAVTKGETVEIDVSDVVTQDGTYSFALKNNSNNLANYSSKEGVQAPELFIKTTFTEDPDDNTDEPEDDDEPQGNPNLPVITSLSPASGSPGTVVTITGQKFNSVTRVAFNGTQTISFVGDSPSQIRATVPFGATTGRVSITSSAGTGKSARDFIVPGPPHISDFKPIEGAPGTEVTITGRNFSDLGSVLFGGASAIFSVKSDTLVIAEVPLGARSGGIQVNNSVGLAESSEPFTVLSSEQEDPSDPTDPEDGEDPEDSTDPEEPSDSEDPNDPSEPSDPGSVTVTLLEDSFVGSNRPERHVGDSHELRVRRSSGADYNSYLKFEVRGLTESVRKATVKLTVIDGSPSGGEIFAVSNNFKDGSLPWKEENLDFNNAPELAGKPLSSLGEVKVGEIAEFDVTPAIDGNGIYSFALSSDNNNLANYSSKEGKSAPILMIATGEVPEDATDPEESEDSEDPSEPEDPSDSDDPTDSEDPTDSDDSSDPEDSTDPSDPFDPDGLTVLLEDSFVGSNHPDRQVGDAHELRVRRSSGADYNSYLKFKVQGLTKSVRKATVKLLVINGSSSGGDIFSVSNHFKDSSSPWKEETLNFRNAPALSGRPLSSVGPVRNGETAAFDVTSAIIGDGVYSFAISSENSNLANYSSKEGKVAPALIIEIGDAPESSNRPVISGFSPNSGPVGSEVTIFGENFIGTVGSQSSLSGTVRIMPLGNSITQGVHGSTDDAGYRNDLAELLHSQGIDFNFVGTRRHGRGFDRHHEGHSGFRADELLAEMDRYLRRNPPNLILLHIGTNDISDNQPNSGTIAEIEQILDMIHEFDNSIITILSSVIPRRDSQNGRTNSLNDLIADLIPSKQAAGHNLHYAGNNEAFAANPNWQNEYLDDSVHPNDLGYAVMAGVWFDSIVEAIGGGTRRRGTLAVAFNGREAVDVTIDSQQRLRATVPSGARSGKITVETKFGTATSSSAFDVLGSSTLAITLPRGGEVWHPGSTHSIAWQSDPNITSVNLEYSPDQGQQWLPIAEGVPNTGRFIWQTPKLISKNVLVRISDFGMSGVSAVSAGAFSLNDDQTGGDLLSFNDLKMAALGNLTEDRELLRKADIDGNGEVNLLDVLNLIDYGADAEAKRLGKASSTVEEKATAEFALTPAVLDDATTATIPVGLRSTTAIRGFQVKLRYRGAEAGTLVPQFDSDMNLITDYRIDDGEIEIMAYLKKENSAVNVQGRLFDLIGQVQELAKPLEAEILESLIVSKNLKSIPLESERSDTKSGVPSEYELLQNYPNPFNLGTQIRFNLPAKTKVSLQIYNLRGELVKTLIDGERDPGIHKISWNGENQAGVTVASGVYVYRLKAGDFEDSRKLTLVK